MPRIAGDDYAAAQAAAEQQRREAAERAQREAAQRQRQQEAAAEAFRAKETETSPSTAFAERLGIDANFARDRFFARLAGNNRTPIELQTQPSFVSLNENPAAYNVADVCPTVAPPPAPAKEEHKGFWDKVQDVASDGAGALVDAGGDVVNGATDFGKGAVDGAIDLGGDALRAGGRFVRGGVEVVVDAGQRTIDFAGDVAGDVKDAAEGALKFAAENGLRLAGRALDAVHNLALKTIDKGLGVGKKIDNLGVGDSYQLGEKLSAGLGVDVTGEGQLEVKRDAKNNYVVSGEISGNVGLKIGAGAAAGLGGKTEFEFDNAADAKKAMLILAGAGAAGSTAMTAPELALALVPHPDEIGFLKDHISAVELKGNISAEVDSKFDVGFADGGASAGAELSSSYRLEFEKGKPVALLRATEISGTGGADMAFNLIHKNMGSQGMNALTAAINNGGEAKGTVNVETRIPLDVAKISDVALFLASPTSAAFAGPSETSLKGTVEVDRGSNGIQAEAGISGLSGREAQQIIGDLAQGKFGEAFKGVDVDASGSISKFEDRGFNPSLDLKVGGFGIEIEGRSEQRNVTVLRG